MNIQAFAYTLFQWLLFGTYMIIFPIYILFHYGVGTVLNFFAPKQYFKKPYVRN